MKCRKTCLLFAALVLFVSSHHAARAGSPPTVPVAPWRAGDSWNLCVEQYSRDWMAEFGGPQGPKPPKAPELVARYFLQVKVHVTAASASLQCWAVDFIPGLHAPKSLGETCRVFVRKRDGFPVKLFQGKNDLTATAIDTIEGTPFLTEAPEGFPLEFMSPLAPRKTRPQPLQTTLDVRTVNSGRTEVLLQSLVQAGEKTPLKVFQMWGPDDRWWREYERYLQGHKDLVARRFAGDPAQVPDGKMPSPLPPTIQVALKGGNGHDAAGLQSDPRLQAKVSAKLRGPKVPDVLARVQQATGVRLVADDGVERNRPAFGTVTWANVPAFIVLQQVAQSKVVQGRWEKAGDGYRLIAGVPSQPGEAADGNAAPSPGVRPWVTGLVLAGILAVTGAILVTWVRRRRAKSPDGK